MDIGRWTSGNIKRRRKAKERWRWGGVCYSSELKVLGKSKLLLRERREGTLGIDLLLLLIRAETKKENDEYERKGE